jgi:hypothetical protein
LAVEIKGRSNGSQVDAKVLEHVRGEAWTHLALATLLMEVDVAPPHQVSIDLHLDTVRAGRHAVSGRKYGAQICRTALAMQKVRIESKQRRGSLCDKGFPLRRARTIENRQTQSQVKRVCSGTSSEGFSINLSGDRFGGRAFRHRNARFGP